MKRVLALAVSMAMVPAGVLALGLGPVEYNLGASLSGSTLRVLDPQHAVFGGTASSSSPTYRLLGTLGDFAIGSSSATTLALRSGFLYFPVIVHPTLAVTAGDGQVTASWTSGAASAGLAIGSHNLCYRLTAGSYPGVCQFVGDTSPTTVTGLTNGTSYTFQVQMLDAYGNLIAESNEPAATPAATGGGGQGSTVLSPTTLQVTGMAYPGATVHVLANGVDIGTVFANEYGAFAVDQDIVAEGTTNLGFWAVDTDGRRSVTFSFAVNIIAAQPNGFGGIFIPPTITVMPTAGDVGITLAVAGQSVPGALVRIQIPGTGLEVTANVGQDGRWTAELLTAGLLPGLYTIRVRTELVPYYDRSGWSQLVQFALGTELPLAECNHPPDVNRSGRIDLVDFSIMAYWWRRELPYDSPADLNCDGVLTLADFSILAYHWTGR